MKLTAIVPILGGVVLLNDQLIGLLHSTLLDGAALPAEGARPSGQRLAFTYLGLTLVGLGATVYSLRCPEIVKRFATPSEWLAGEEQMLTGLRLQEEVLEAVEAYWRNSYGDTSVEVDEIRKPIGAFGKSALRLGVLVQCMIATYRRSDESIEIPSLNSDSAIAVLKHAHDDSRAVWIPLLRAAVDHRDLVVEARYGFLVLDRPCSRLIATVFYTSGFSVLFFLTADTFIKVVKVVFSA